ncbi:hypothetical protein C3941_09230 [Kaistia algarum]|uniref:hypothetical protein n=1 Tax=Kaistia algarum TaxID=2083279 RepID=UPI000CE8CE13|nr:hypothetical protein [Kaistia algarum]MCX5512241.1 hypothetical protein [Kaistia algarum]PPE80335.1 hypothetical protein C3941_09230 [Kaistia algarum]
MAAVVIASQNVKSPTGLSYFTGQISLETAASGCLVWIPGTSWFAEEALRIAEVEAARRLVAEFSQRSPSWRSWFVMIAHRVEAAA